MKHSTATVNKLLIAVLVVLVVGGAIFLLQSENDAIPEVSSNGLRQTDEQSIDSGEVVVLVEASANLFDDGTDFLVRSGLPADVGSVLKLDIGPTDRWFENVESALDETQESDVKLAALSTVLLYGSTMPREDRIRFGRFEPQLRALLSDPDPEIKRGAIHRLAFIPQLSEVTVSRLIEIVGEGDSNYLQSALSTLASASGGRTEVGKMLIPFVTDARVEVRRAVLWTVDTLHYVDSELANAVRSRLRDPDPTVRQAVVSAFRSEAFAEHVEEDDKATFMEIAQSRSEESKIRTEAVHTIGKLAARNSYGSANEELRTIASDVSISTEVRDEAIRSLPYAEGYSVETERFLQALLNDPNLMIRDAAEWGLSTIKKRREQRRLLLEDRKR